MDLRDVLGSAAEHVSVRRAFGEGYEKDGALIIPVAFVAGGGGGGGSETASLDDDDFDEDEDGPTSEFAPRGGAGAGFGGVVIPLGVYVAKEDRVRFVPTINVTLLAVAAAILVRSLTRARRAR